MNFKTLVITTFFSGFIAVTSVNASTVSGNIALNLRASLIKAGATAHVYTDASFVKVDKVTCSQEGGFLLMPIKCQFIEEGRLVDVDAGPIANSLESALRLAGATENTNHLGEYSKRVVIAKAVECSTSMMPRFMSCTITK